MESNFFWLKKKKKVGEKLKTGSTSGLTGSNFRSKRK